MKDHLPECRRWFTDMPAPDECPTCEMFRACEERVRDSHIAILEFARPSGKCNCDSCADHDWLISDLIHALKEKP